MSWVADRGGFGREYHSRRCIAVEMYEQVYEPVETLEECPKADPLVRCPLCEHGIGPGEERYAPLDRELASALTPDAFGVGDRASTTRHLDPLRTITSFTEAQLVEENFLPENTGVEVRSRRDWQSTHHDVADTPLFEFLLRDAVEAHLVFYRAHKGYNDDETFIGETLDASGTAVDRSAKNVVETCEWLQTIGVPETLETRQASFAAFASE